MKTYYLEVTITLEIEAENAKEAYQKLDEIPEEDFVKEGEWSEGVVLNDEFEEIGEDE